MKETKNSLTTDEIFQKIQNGEPISKEEIEFITPEQLRIDLYNDIKKSGYSINGIATECHITPSQLSDFLNNKKQMNRDKLLSLFITLGYPVTKIKQLLIRFGYNELYTRNVRDFVILKGIKEELGLDEINERLRKETLDTLCQEK